MACVPKTMPVLVESGGRRAPGAAVAAAAAVAVAAAGDVNGPTAAPAAAAAAASAAASAVQVVVPMAAAAGCASCSTSCMVVQPASNQARACPTPTPAGGVCSTRTARRCAPRYSVRTGSRLPTLCKVRAWDTVSEDRGQPQTKHYTQSAHTCTLGMHVYTHDSASSVKLAPGSREKSSRAAPPAVSGRTSPDELSTGCRHIYIHTEDSMCPKEISNYLAHMHTQTNNMMLSS